MFGPLFERFTENTPLTVMTRALLENVLRPEPLDELFERMAVQQYERELLFSTVVDTMALVACRSAGLVPDLVFASDRDHRDAQMSPDHLGDRAGGHPLLTDGVPDGPRRRLFQSQPEHPGGVGAVYGRPNIGSIADVAGDALLASDPDDGRDEAVVSSPVSRGWESDN